MTCMLPLLCGGIAGSSPLSGGGCSLGIFLLTPVHRCLRPAPPLAELGAAGTPDEVEESERECLK